MLSLCLCVCVCARMRVCVCVCCSNIENVPQGWICLGTFTCYHTEIGVADQTITRSQRVLIVGEPVVAVTP